MEVHSFEVPPGVDNFLPIEKPQPTSEEPGLERCVGVILKREKMKILQPNWDRKSENQFIMTGMLRAENSSKKIQI